MIGQAIADGILSGAVISLGAIGLSLSLQVLRFANFAHSELLSWGAYLTLTFVGLFGVGSTIGPFSFGWGLIVATVLSGAAVAVMAIVASEAVFSRLRARGSSPLILVFAAFGVALIMRHLIVLIWGPEVQYYTRELQMAVEVLPGIRMLPDQLFVLGLTLIALVGFHCLLRYTRMGIAMRGMAESRPLAQICGIAVESVTRWTWAVTSILAALAGVCLGLTSQIKPEMGFHLLLGMFTAMIIGGVGSLAGAVIGGLVIGVAENVSVLYISAGYKQVTPFILLIAVLYVRPNGIFGQREG